MKVVKILPLIVFAFCVIIPLRAEAAVLTLKPGKDTVSLEESFKVTLLIDSRGQEINTIKAKLVFPSDEIELLDSSQEHSIISYWVERPGMMDEGSFTFGGVIPGGFSGQEGVVLDLFFRAKKSGLAEINITDIVVLLNDSKGSRLSTVGTKGVVTIGKEKVAEKEVIVSWQDNDPPEDFTVSAARQKEVFDGQWFAAFDAQDRGLGIDHYEIQESRTGSPQENEWVKVDRGPYLLKDQKLRSYVYVKAIDKANNARMVMLYPPAKPDYLKYIFILIISCLFAVILARMIKKHLKKVSLKQTGC